MILMHFLNKALDAGISLILGIREATTSFHNNGPAWNTTWNTTGTTVLLVKLVGPGDLTRLC